MGARVVNFNTSFKERPRLHGCNKKHSEFLEEALYTKMPKRGQWYVRRLYVLQLNLEVSAICSIASLLVRETVCRISLAAKNKCIVYELTLKNSLVVYYRRCGLTYRIRSLRGAGLLRIRSAP